MQDTRKNTPLSAKEIIEDFIESLRNPSLKPAKLPPQISLALAKKLLERLPSGFEQLKNKLEKLIWEYENAKDEATKAKALAELLLLLEASYNEETPEQAYLAGKDKTPRKPLDGGIAAAVFVPVGHVYYEFQLLKGTKIELQALFSQWLAAVQVAKPELKNKDPEVTLSVRKDTEGREFLALKPNPSATTESPYKNMFGDFLQKLMLDEYISTVGQRPPMTPHLHHTISSVSSNASSVFKAPRLIPGEKKSTAKEEEEQEKRSLFDLRMRPKAPGDLT